MRVVSTMSISTVALRSILLRVAAAAIALFLGWQATGQLNKALAIKFADKELPRPRSFLAQPPSPPAAPVAAKQLQLRLVDEGAVGILPDPEHWGDNYSHNVRAYQHVVLPQAPWIDDRAFAGVEAQWRSYIDQVAKLGYNGVVVHGFLEFVSFSKVGDGRAVYGADPLYTDRHRALLQQFRRLFQYSAAKGLPVYLLTDMVALTPALERYLEGLEGGLRPRNPRVWETYRAGLEELFDNAPEVAGLMIRIGEAGAIYNTPGWDYRSELLVRDPESLQQMLRGLLPVFESRNKTLIFRTWSVGVGKVGDMHTNPATYEKAIGPLDSPNLVLSTKYCMGDYDSFLPLNPTLYTGRHRRIVEFQARREFEGFNAFPNYMGPLYQAALQSFLAKNPQIIGAWVWTQGGGPLRAGPLSLYPFEGYTDMIDANVDAISALLANPNGDIAAIAAAWSQRRFPGSPATARAATDLLLQSHEIVQLGHYIGPFARRQVRALGLEPPPMLWIFKWDIVSGSTSELSAVYFLSRDEVDVAIEEGDRAVELLREHDRRLEQASATASAADRPALENLRNAVAYEIDLFKTLGAYRRFFLRHYQWVDHGGDSAPWRKAQQDYDSARAAHITRYGKDLDFPAYNFFAADVGEKLIDRGPAMAWLARLLLLSVIALFAWLIWRKQNAAPPLPDHNRRLLGTAFLITLPLSVAVFSAFASYWFVIGLGGAALLFVSVYAVVGGARSPGDEAWRGALAILGPTLVALIPIAVRGPVYFWLRFWTAPEFRDLWFTVYAAAFLLMLFWMGADRGLRQRGGAKLPIAATLLGFGAGLLWIAAWLGLPGLETALTALNDQIAVLPLGLSRILGITTHLAIPLKLPAGMAVAAVLLALPGAALWYLSQRPGKNRAA